MTRFVAPASGMFFREREIGHPGVFRKQFVVHTAMGAEGVAEKHGRAAKERCVNIYVRRYSSASLGAADHNGSHRVILPFFLETAHPVAFGVRQCDEGAMAMSCSHLTKYVVSERSAGGKFAHNWTPIRADASFQWRECTRWRPAPKGTHGEAPRLPAGTHQLGCVANSPYFLRLPRFCHRPRRRFERVGSTFLPQFSVFRVRQASEATAGSYRVWPSRKGRRTCINGGGHESDRFGFFVGARRIGMNVLRSALC